MGFSIYDEFYDLMKDRATCKKCYKEVSRKDSTTTGLRKHLEKNHKDDFLRLEGQKNQPSTKKRKIDGGRTPTIASSFGAWQPGGSRFDTASRALSLMIAVDSQPFAMVDRPGFRNFLTTVAPSFKLRSRTSLMRTDVPALFDEYKQRVHDRVRKAKYVSFTTDSWSSEDNKHSLLSLTAHWILNGKLEFRIMGILPIHGRHTGDNLANLLSQCLADFLEDDVEKKCHLIVRDAASVMKKTTKIHSVDPFSWKIFRFPGLFRFRIAFSIFSTTVFCPGLSRAYPASPPCAIAL
ncbi:hypothetical protein L596_006622 [Steinernema carpocapsae]|uniref:BED-type domain-containing protein n=1 Tax=Steinernema carpocapsae TaxID=34508 RepID=A0A4U8V5D2_STECR|nr:hypothetical protein L596_006622 [Steinernema carpocapsae]